MQTTQIASALSTYSLSLLPNRKLKGEEREKGERERQKEDCQVYFWSMHLN